MLSSELSGSYYLAYYYKIKTWTALHAYSLSSRWNLKTSKNTIYY